jgi:GT2 family glycosyltransferase
MNKKYHIAVLLTCHNRKSKTLESLEHLYNAKLPSNYSLDTFLVNDGSSDGTKEGVKEQFPSVKIIEGTGELYWNGGMRLAWETAAKHSDYDFYLWLNDDTNLYETAIEALIDCYFTALKSYNVESLIIGSCESEKNSNEFSYGGRTDAGAVVPNGNLQQATYVNGNAVLVPKAIFNKIGNLSSDYTHGIGDNAYGLEALKHGFKVFITNKYIATCPINENMPKWMNPELPLIQRWKSLHTPLGLNIKEYATYRKRYFKDKWRSYVLKAYTKVLFPSFYDKLKKLK